VLGAMLVAVCLFAGGYVVLFGMPGKRTEEAPAASFQRVAPPGAAFGRIRGRCRIARPVVPWRVFAPRCKDAPGQRATILTESVVASEDGGLGGCVVSLVRPAPTPEDLAAGPESTFTLRVTKDGFAPHVAATRVRTQLVLASTFDCDACPHGFHDTLAKTRFNVALGPHAVLADLESAFLEPPGLYLFRDDCHAESNAYLHVFAHPWFDVTSGEDEARRRAGEFVLADVPPGDLEVVAWHESMTRNEVLVDRQVATYDYAPAWTGRKKVHVGAGETVAVDFVVPVPDEIPPPPAVHDPHRAR
jgi:hypothetical protein